MQLSYMEEEEEMENRAVLDASTSLQLPRLGAFWIIMVTTTATPLGVSSLPVSITQWFGI
jgi:hypothetical protein